MGCSSSMPRLPVAYLGFQPCQAHKPVDFIRTTPFTIFPQILMDLPVTVDTAGLQPELLDQPCEPIICLLTSGLGLLPPGVIATRMDVQQVTQPADRP